MDKREKMKLKLAHAKSIKKPVKKEEPKKETSKKSKLE
tara:strand:+ start:565 stop:678 length:114 start_codon:yes stop_codon:yes gene_type:complete